MNNYDQNSKGLNIELDIFRDQDLSRMYFDESITKEAGVYQYINYGNIEPLTCIEDFLQLTSEGKSDAILNNYAKEDIKELTDDEKADCYCNHLTGICSDKFSWSELQDIDRCEHDEVELKDGFELVNVIGYCQGDSEYILVNKTKLAEAWGVESKKVVEQIGEEIKHLFYDTPINVDLKVNGVEYSNDALDIGYYDYNRDKTIARMVAVVDFEDKELLKSELENLVPTELEYC